MTNLSDTDTKKIPGGRAKIITYCELGNLYGVDQLLPGEKVSASSCARTTPTNKRHSTAFSEHRGLYEHVDSYNEKPDNEFTRIGAKRDELLNQDEP